MESQVNNEPFVSLATFPCNNNKNLKTETIAEKEVSIEHQDAGGVEKTILPEEKSSGYLRHPKLTNYFNKKMEQTLATPIDENETKQENEVVLNKNTKRLDPTSEPSLIEKAVDNNKSISEEDEVFQVLSAKRSAKDRKTSPYRPNSNNNANHDKDTRR